MRIKKVTTQSGRAINVLSTGSWIEHEVGRGRFNDVRLAKRFSKLMKMMSNGIGESVPSACQDWANTKAAYRFFSNANVSEEQIMAGHFQATRGRLSQTNRMILMLHDTIRIRFRTRLSILYSALAKDFAPTIQDGAADRLY